jgi:DNA-binding NarL/FixJ family response regulator
MKKNRGPYFLTQDAGLFRHWQSAFKADSTTHLTDLASLNTLAETDCVLWVDLAMPGLGIWNNPIWARLTKELRTRIVAASSNPHDDEAVTALDAGCLAYCHAYSDAATLLQVQDVVVAGNVWIGRSLMARLLAGTAKASKHVPGSQKWALGLTQREVEVSVLAANGASNQAIAEQCHITERTVKAHLSAAFEKLHVTDRLQLALRVHGIQ